MLLSGPQFPGVCDEELDHGPSWLASLSEGSPGPHRALSDATASHEQKADTEDCREHPAGLPGGRVGR